MEKDTDTLRIFSYGTSLYDSLLAVKQFQENYKGSITVIEVPCMTDSPQLVKLAQGCEYAVVIDPCRKQGSIGSSIVDTFGTRKINVTSLYAAHSYNPSGPAKDLTRHTPDTIRDHLSRHYLGSI